MYLSVTPLLLRFLLCATFVQFTLAQDLTWVQYPTEVVTGQSYPIEWAPRGVSVTVQILKGGQYDSTIFYTPDGTTTNFNWNVANDLEAGTNYLLQVVPANGGQLLSSGTVWVISSKNGLVVNGETITASIQDGPTAAAPTGASSEVVTVTSGGSSYVVTTDVGAAEATDAVRTLTYVSGSNTFTQTITLSSSPTGGSRSNSSIPRGLTGGEIAGIVIGILAGVALIVGLSWFLRRKQRQRKAAAAGLAGTGEKDDASMSGTTANDVEGNRNTMMSGTSELAGSESGGLSPGGFVDKKQHTYQPYRVPRSEMDGSSSRYEMPGAPVPTYELPAEDVPRRGPQIPSTCVPLNPDEPADKPKETTKPADGEDATKSEGEKGETEEKSKEEQETKSEARSSSPKPTKPIEPDA